MARKAPSLFTGEEKWQADLFATSTLADLRALSGERMAGGKLVHYVEDLAQGRSEMTSTPAVAVRSQFSRHIVYVPRNWERYHMSRLYGPLHRSLQDRFDTRWLADNVETHVVLTEIPQEHKAFIESRDMFFLSTIDHQGRPAVPYKSGDPGFVRVLDSRTVAFPCYDGSGMFYSIGNVLGKGAPLPARPRRSRVD